MNRQDYIGKTTAVFLLFLFFLGMSVFISWSRPPDTSGPMEYMKTPYSLSEREARLDSTRKAPVSISGNDRLIVTAAAVMAKSWFNDEKCPTLTWTLTNSEDLQDFSVDLHPSLDPVLHNGDRSQDGREIMIAGLSW